MELVIKIPEEYYKAIKEIPVEQSSADMLIIRTGTPLPEGHGRLIDADEILKAMNTWDKFGYTETGCFVKEPQNDYVPYVHYEDMVKAVNGAPIIIEADKAESEDKDADKKCTYKETGCGSCKWQLDCPIEADKTESEDAE